MHPIYSPQKKELIIKKISGLEREAENEKLRMRVLEVVISVFIMRIPVVPKSGCHQWLRLPPWPPLPVPRQRATVVRIQAWENPQDCHPNGPNNIRWVVPHRFISPMTMAMVFVGDISIIFVGL